jgi:hypothetical protein
MSGRTGEARWPGCPQAERLARQRSASLDPFEADPRSGRIGKPEDSQGTVSRSDRKTTRRNDKLISKKTRNFFSLIPTTTVLSIKLLNIAPGTRPKEEEEEKLFFGINLYSK